MRKGLSELEASEAPLGWVRRPGGGGKRVADLDPGLRPVLLSLVEPNERGDPMSPLCWTVKSTCTLARELTRSGHKSAPTSSSICCERRTSACRPTPRPWRAASTRTGMPSSTILTSKSAIAGGDAQPDPPTADEKDPQRTGTYHWGDVNVQRPSKTTRSA